MRCDADSLEPELAMSAVEPFAEALSETLDRMAISTYDLARMITAKFGDQGASTYVEGTSRDALDDYRHGLRPPRRQAWNAIRSMLRDRCSEEQAEALDQLDKAYEDGLRSWRERKQEAKRPESSLKARFVRRLVPFGGWALSAGLVAWITWVTISGEARSQQTTATPSQTSGNVVWKSKAPKSELRTYEPAVWGKIDKPEADESFETYEYLAVIPSRNAGNAIRLGIAGAGAPLELLLYKNGKFLEGRFGTDVFIDFTDDGSRRWLRVRNWNRQDVRFLTYFVIRQRN